MLQLPGNLFRLLRRRVHKSGTVTKRAELSNLDTHLRLTLFLIFFLRFSFVTSSSASSLSAYCDEDPFNLRVGLFTSCRTTSSTVSAGSIRVLTVTPSSVVTLLVGTRDDGLLELMVEAEVVCRSDMTCGWRQPAKGARQLGFNSVDTRGMMRALILGPSTLSFLSCHEDLEPIAQVAK